MGVQMGPNSIRSLSFQFISVHQDSPQFNPTAEVAAEVNPLRAVQRVNLNRPGYSGGSGLLGREDGIMEERPSSDPLIRTATNAAVCIRAWSRWK
jgi:hypothetical protein